MPWLGRKQIAFFPVHRSNAHPPDEPVPADWPNDIRRRVFFDPDPMTKADRSLRAYIHAASSGRADFDAFVMPPRTIDQQDVPVGFLEPQLGPQLRNQGFNAAALVMLGQPPTGSGELGGFWARFDRSEGVGTWALELMHVLANFDDLYTWGGNMGRFDNMAGASGSHPSAFTKAAVGWLDASAIAQHPGSTAQYDLHSVGLVQPPPSGRWAAVKIGAQVPYLMVEARQKVDQFDGDLLSEGVIVYQVATSDPRGSAQNQVAAVTLRTTIAVAVGQSFTSNTGITVQVVAALPGGFTVNIHDPAHATVPDVFELSATNARKAVQAAGLVAKFTGQNHTGSWVSSQSPLAGKIVAPGSTVTMLLRTGPIL
jgi:PASTA domain-containing protein